MTFSRFLWGLPAWQPLPALPPLWACAAVPLIFVASQVASFLVIQALYADAAAVHAPSQPGMIFVGPQELMALMLWLLTGQIAMIGLVLAIAGWGGQTREILRLQPPEGGAWAYIWAVLVMAGAVVAVNVATHLLRPEGLTEDLKLYTRLVGSDAFPVATIAVALGAPLSEELLFRGLLLPSLALTRLGFAGGAVAATLLWAALHWGYTLAGLMEVTVFGLVLSWLLWRTGSLRVPLLCHALYNGLLLMAIWFLAPA